MKKLSEINITKYKNAKSKYGIQIPLFQELRDIKFGTHKIIIEACRKAISDNDYDKYNSLKIGLPAVTFCGEFGNIRKATDISYYNNLIVIDIDKIGDRLSEIKQVLAEDKFILALWISPSGNGLKGLIRINCDTQNHKLAFSSVKNYIFEKYKVEIDESGKDVSRLCFCSWDENIIYNKDALVFSDIETVEMKSTKKKSKVNSSLSKSAYATEGLNKSSDRELMKRIIKYLQKKNISITTTHAEWVKLALIISYTFSYDVGEKYFLSLCQLDHDKHDENKSIELLRYCYNKRDIEKESTVNFASLVYLVKQKGFK